MALSKQLVPLPIDKGLDTKFDPKQEELGYLRKAENVVYETVKLFKKRNGYDEIDRYTTSEALISEPLIMTKYKNEPIMLTESRIYSHSSSRDRWVDKGAIYATKSDTRSVIKNAKSQSQVDGLAVDNFSIFVWKDSAGGVRYSVQDINNKSFLISDAVLSATGERPVLAHIQNYIYVIYGDGAAVKFKKFSILTPSTLTAATTVISNRDTTNGLIDAESCGTKVLVTYNASNAGDNVSIFAINQDDTTSSILSLTSTAASSALDIMCDSLNRVIITFSNGTNLRTTIYPFTLSAAILAPTIIEAVASVSSCCVLETSAGVYKIYYEVAASGSANNYIKQASLVVAGTVSGISVFKRSVGLGTRAFRRNSISFIMGVHDSEVQSSYFLFDENGYLVTKFANQTAGGVIDYGVLQPCIDLGSDKYLIPLIVRNRLKSDSGTFFSTDGVAASILEFSPESKFSNAQLADGLHVCAGVLKYYDGSSVTEHGFHVFPETLTQGTVEVTVTPATTVTGVTGVTSEEQTLTFNYVPGSGSYRLNYAGEDTTDIAWNASTATIKAAIEATAYITSTVTVTGSTAAGFLIVYNNTMGDVVQPTITSNSLASPTTGGSMSNGSYGYIAAYRWTDNNGKDHRSAPTQLPLTVVLSGGTSTQQVSINVPTLRITEKNNAVLELYRTEDAGTTYYKVTNDLVPVLNDATVDSIEILDTTSDTDLIDNELLYTTGNVLENIPAPACFQVVAYNGDRLAVVGEDSNRVYFSKQVSEGAPVEFTDAIYRDVDPVGGSVTTLKAINEKLIIFESDASFYVSGEGPNNIGEQDTLTKPEIVSTDLGCTIPESAVLTPNGIMFKSRKGIWLASPSLQLQYIGARVEEFNAATVTSALVIGKLNQVRFTLSEDRALVYNYALDRWATFENHGARSAVVIGDDYYYLREDGALYKENTTAFSDASSPIKMRVETGWLSLTELQGFQRVYHAMILGSYKSSHKLRIKVAYNFIDAWVQEELIDPLNFMTPTAYGEDSPYGSGSPYGGDGSLYQMRIDFKIQKCQAIKLLIEDVQDTIGEGLSLSAVTLRVGAKEGSGKINSARKFGTN